MKLLIVLVILLLLAGPLRRPLLRSWMLILPFIIGGIIAWPIVIKHMSGSATTPMIIIGFIFAGLVIAGTIKQFIDETMRPPRN